MSALLSVESLTVRFGGLAAVDDVSILVEEGEIAGLVGPNGAGKTTLFNAITRNVDPERGTVRIDGHDISGRRPEDLAALGLRRTFQNLALFESQDVRTNVLIGAHTGARTGWLRAALGWGVRAEERALGARADHLLEVLDLEQMGGAVVADLPFGTMKRVELARALASRPRVLLLDEPANGLREAEVLELEALLRRIRDEFGVTIVMVDHHVRLVMSLCDHVVALAAGRVIADGTARETRSDPAVRRVFLGESA
ncbi:ABC transporter ATP-binding protein [Nocardioides humi]|uniref:ABC transporter ATP-binding protein n=1 Tax=Nocardioides humi TaxID=449461 RepID=A0ABN2A5S6_9ACTN|nr:ABC transporter ATP-binding protein [Nocardioides humi]